MKQMRKNNDMDKRNDKIIKRRGGKKNMTQSIGKESKKENTIKLRRGKKSKAAWKRWEKRNTKGNSEKGIDERQAKMSKREMKLHNNA